MCGGWGGYYCYYLKQNQKCIFFHFYAIHTLHLCFSRDNFLVLDIFFEALNYETIEQKKAYDVAGLLGKIAFSCPPEYQADFPVQSERRCYSSSNLFPLPLAAHRTSYGAVSIMIFLKYSLLSGDIGGQMGLFIGASILTILEILDYVYEVLCL